SLQMGLSSSGKNVVMIIHQHIGKYIKMYLSDISPIISKKSTRFFLSIKISLPSLPRDIR
ncbi:MAG: hypothetical protein SV375_16255, partial [Thermodesulfobacteriota bacterium]|nr:hypothetical protein [Thermodesulfobacteriota bacterium]